MASPERSRRAPSKSPATAARPKRKTTQQRRPQAPAGQRKAQAQLPISVPLTGAEIGGSVMDAQAAQGQAPTQAQVEPTKPPRAATRNTATDYNDSAQRDPQALATRDELRAQEKVPVYLQWTAEDEKAFQGNRPLPYRRVETVHINGVEYHVERGKMNKVPLSVAVILADAGMIAIDQLPDCRDKEVLMAERDKAEKERQARYARRGLDLVR